MMYSIKLYIIKVIIVVAILQIGSLFINIPSYKQLYAIAGGIILISTFFSLPATKVEFPDVNIPEKTEIADYQNIWQIESEKNIEKLIYDDLVKEYHLECIVEVQTDMKTLNINISYNNENVSPDQIYDFVKKKYCTDNDKVIVENEK